MYWMQWSRSAGLASGPCLEMMRIAESWVVITMRSISSRRSFTCGCRVTAASQAVWLWNSAGKLILKRMFSIT